MESLRHDGQCVGRTMVLFKEWKWRVYSWNV